MLATIFLKLLETSIQASFFIFAIVIIRFFFKSLPKRYVCILWTLVAIRLLCPLQITSEISLVPDVSRVQELADISYTVSAPVNETYVPSDDISFTQNMGFVQTSQANGAESAGIDVLFFDTSPEAFDSIEKAPVTNIASSYIEETPKPLLEHTEITLPNLLAGFWVIGAVGLVVYGLISYFRTKYRLREAVHDKENIWYCAGIPSPFVLGYVKPRIYIPFSVDEEQLPYIIAHEKSHIAHFDHISKLLGYLILCLYWFNPVIWLGYVLYCRDLELACDERALTELGTEQKKAYSNALLACSVSNKALLQSPLAFSEVAIKTRIVNILNYKKPGFWGVVLAVVICVVAALCFMTSTEPDAAMTEAETTATEGEMTGIDSAEIDEKKEPIAHYEDVNDLIQANIDYWQTHLLAEGKITEEQNVYEYKSGYNIEFTTIALHATTDVICYYYTLDEHYIYTLYRTIVTCKRELDGFYVYAYNHASLDNATTAAEAEEMLVLYHVYGLDGTKEREWTLGRHVTDSYLQGWFSSVAPPDNSDVETPANALQALMHFSVGTAETFPGRDDNSAFVLYTFADGSQVAYEMKRALTGNSSNSAGLYWYPYGQIRLEEAEEARKTEEYILKTTLTDLEGITQKAEYSNWLPEDLPETYSLDTFCIIDEIPEKNVTLYSLANGNALIIKDGETVYPLFYSWTSPRLTFPEIFKSDYDQDGVEEYALYVLYGSGSGVNLMGIIMLEPDGDSLRMQEFTMGEVLEQLNSSFSYEYVDHTFYIDTYTEHVELNVEYWESKLNTVYSEIGWGDLIEFEERDGQWWITVPAGILERNNVSPWYNCGVIFTAPVTYYNNKYFEIGSLSMEVVDDRSYFGD